MFYFITEHTRIFFCYFWYYIVIDIFQLRKTQTPEGSQTNWQSSLFLCVLLKFSSIHWAFAEFSVVFLLRNEQMLKVAHYQFQKNNGIWYRWKNSTVFLIRIHESEEKNSKIQSSSRESLSHNTTAAKSSRKIFSFLFILHFVVFTLSKNQQLGVIWIFSALNFTRPQFGRSYTLARRSRNRRAETVKCFSWARLSNVD